tara:strand:+ start:1059 stop:2204 length:1146 start_codon:yes stop_codon:yes gene_type:complete
MNYILFDVNRESLFPLTHTRPISEIRIGILTIKEKWVHHIGSEPSTLTTNYLQAKYPLQKEADNVYINGGVSPNKALVEAIFQLADGEGLYSGDTLLAYRNAAHQKVSFNGEFTQIEKLWHIFQYNATELQADFDLLTAGHISKNLSDTNLVMGSENIFVAEGAKVEGAILNATTGPIYIGKNAEVMEGSIVRGPLAMCEHSVLKMGAKIYGATTLGPYCKVGGEVNNSVLIGYSNKGHDGFLGNSVLGEWCNIGADTNNSNLKNNYTEVRLWSEQAGCFEKTGLQFCGLIMGDHSKCGINTMFNTGTVVGVSSNIFGPGFPRNFVPSFAWGGSAGYSTYQLPKVFEVAEKVMARRGIAFDDKEKVILEQVFNLTSEQRNF